MKTVCGSWRDWSRLSIKAGGTDKDCRSGEDWSRLFVKAGGTDENWELGELVKTV